MFWIIRVILIGFVAGYLSFEFMKKGHASYVEEFVVGFIGSIIGHLLFRLIGLGSFSFIGELIIATAGACLYLHFMKK